MKSPLPPSGPLSFRTITPTLVLKVVWAICCSLKSCLVVSPIGGWLLDFFFLWHCQGCDVTMSKQWRRSCFSSWKTIDTVLSVLTHFSAIVLMFLISQHCHSPLRIFTHFRFLSDKTLNLVSKLSCHLAPSYLSSLTSYYYPFLNFMWIPSVSLFLLPCFFLHHYLISSLSLTNSYLSRTSLSTTSSFDHIDLQGFFPLFPEFL